MIEEIRANMKKELDQQKAKVEMAGRQRAMIAQQGERVEKQHAECKVVLMELGSSVFANNFQKLAYYFQTTVA